jgi:uncharacterized protein YaiL (DUF2058 family)
MGDSLQDQLRALGLARSKPAAKKGKQPRSGKAQQHDKRKVPKSIEELSLDEAYALRQRAEQREVDRARRQKREEDRRRRQVNKAIRDIVASHRQNRDAAEIPRHFVFNGRIRKVYVDAEQQRALNEGGLGIVYLTGGYHLLESAALEAVRQISSEHVVDLDLDAGDEDPEHPIPDDLVW